MKPKITALIPTFNRPELLERTLNSILCQGYQHVVVHVADNSCNNESAHVVGKISSLISVKYFKHNENIGARNNFKFLVNTVTTDFYHIISDDDMLALGFYSEWERLLEEDPTSSFFCLRTLIVNTKSSYHSVLSSEWKPGIYNPSVDTLMRLANSHFCSTSIIFNKKHISNNPLLLEPLGSDQVALIQLGANYRFSVSDKIGGVFFFDEANISWSSKLSIAYAMNTLRNHLLLIDSTTNNSLIQKTRDYCVGRLYAKIFISVVQDELSIRGSQNVAAIRKGNLILFFKDKIKPLVLGLLRFLRVGRFSRWMSPSEHVKLKDPNKAIEVIDRYILVSYLN